MKRPADESFVSSSPHRNRKPEEKNGARRLRFVTAWELGQSEPEIVPWVVTDFLAESSITELGGKAKAAGKTTFMLQMVRAVLDGQLFLGRTTTKSPVVYVSEEDPTTLRIALERAGLLDRQDLVLLPRRETIGKAWKVVAEAIGEETGRLGARLLVVDTFPGLIGIKGDGENASGEMQEAIEPLRLITGTQKIAVVLVTHERKSGGQIGEATRGSSSFAGAVDQLMLLRRRSKAAGDTTRSLESIGRLSNLDLVVERTESGRYVCVTGAGRGPSTKRRVLDALSTDPTGAVPIRTVMSKAAVGRELAETTLEELRKEGRADRSGRGVRNDAFVYWRIEEQGRDESD